MTAGAIIVAAGSSSRMLGVDKLFAPLARVPLLAHTVGVFAGSPLVDQIVVVAAPSAVLRVGELAAQFGRPVATVAGGVRRQDSVAAGLRRLGAVDFVLVHDGARPALTPDMIERGIEAARATGAAIAAIPVVDTIKEVDSAGSVLRTLDRSSLWAVQTPQVFRRDLLERAHAEVTADVTDDAAMVEQLGIEVRIFDGAVENLKVTTPSDLAIVEALLVRRHLPAATP